MNPPDGDQPTRTALYRLFDVQDRLLYVGITKDVDVRWAQHAREKSQTWWPDVHQKSVEWFGTRTEAAGAEIAAIASEGPLHNRSGTSSPLLVSASGAIQMTWEELNQFEWVTTSALATRLVAEKIEKSMTRQRIMQLAESDPTFPIQREQWRYFRNMWLWPWEIMAPYFRNRVRQPRGKRRDLEGKPTTKGHGVLKQAQESFGDQPFTRTDLRAVLQLSEAGVAQNVVALEKQGLLKQVGTRPSRSGRKPHILYSVASPTDP